MTKPTDTRTKEHVAEVAAARKGKPPRKDRKEYDLKYESNNKERRNRIDRENKRAKREKNKMDEDGQEQFHTPEQTDESSGNTRDTPPAETPQLSGNKRDADAEYEKGLSTAKKARENDVALMEQQVDKNREAGQKDIQALGAVIASRNEVENLELEWLYQKTSRSTPVPAHGPRVETPASTPASSRSASPAFGASASSPAVSRTTTPFTAGRPHPRVLQMSTIDEHQETDSTVAVASAPPKMPELRLLVAKGDFIGPDMYLDWYATSELPPDITGMVQVRDCTVFLSGGKIVPACCKPGTLKNTPLILDQDNEPNFVEILACGDLLLGVQDGNSTITLFKYKGNGTFQPPVSVEMASAGAIALSLNWVHSFGGDVKNETSAATMQRLRLQDVLSGSLTPETTGLELLKKRTRVKIASKNDKPLVLGFQTKGGVEKGKLFIPKEPTNGPAKLAMSNKFNDGQVKDIVGNANHYYVLLADGSVYYSVSGDWFTVMDHEGNVLEGVERLEAGDNFCLCIKNHTVVCLTHDERNKIRVEEWEMDGLSACPQFHGIHRMGGSDSYVAVLCMVTPDDADDEFDESDDNKKPAAVTNGEAAANMPDNAVTNGGATATIDNVAHGTAAAQQPTGTIDNVMEQGEAAMQSAGTDENAVTNDGAAAKTPDTTHNSTD